MIYPDTTGNIVVLQFDQAVADYGLTGVSQGTRLLMEDITGDGKEDLIVSDRSELRAYDSEYQRLFKKNFDAVIKSDVKAFRFSKQDQKIGVVTSRGQMLINPDGSIVDGFPIEADDGFVIYDLDRNGTLEVIGIHNNQLFCKEY